MSQTSVYNVAVRSAIWDEATAQELNRVKISEIYVFIICVINRETITKLWENKKKISQGRQQSEQR